MSTNNFKDPVGVVYRMLRSGDPVARDALIREFWRVCLIPLDIVAGPIERRRVRRTEATNTPVLLVVGAPRSGTSMVQQLLVSHLQVSFVPNGAGLLPRAPMLGARLFGACGLKAPKEFTSYLGQTRTRFGPSDAFFLWDRWLGQARGQTHGALGTEQQADMRLTFNAWMKSYGGPLVNKNNRNTVCMTAVAKALPEARFLVVRRDPSDAAISLLRARKEVQGDLRIAWGLLAKDAPACATELQVLEVICEQLIEIEALVRAQVAELGHDRTMCVDLEEVCADPAAFINGITNWMPVLKQRPGAVSELRPLTYRRYDENSSTHMAQVRRWLTPITRP